MPQELAYTPAAILNVFNNAIAVRETRQLVRLKGIYAPGRGANYGGIFYDSLKDGDNGRATYAGRAGAAAGETGCQYYD